MRIGILTLPIETNYGGILQTYALQKVLRKMGHDVYTIDRHNRRRASSLFSQAAGYIKRNYSHYVLHKNVSTNWNPFLTEQEERIISSDIQPFVESNIKLTRRVYSTELEQIDKEYLFDSYVVGSDQIWLPNYFPESFLSFVNRPNVKRVIYAASCGKYSWMNDNKNHNIAKHYATFFQGVSVREDYLAPLSESILEKSVQHVLDPTMLLNPSEYIEDVKTITAEKPILFSYILDDTLIKSKIEETVAKRNGLEVVYGKNKRQFFKGTKEDIGNYVCYSMDNWINGFNNAEFVLTDSFHGTVFSILFNKPFLTIGNTKRGINRFLSLLKLFNLEDRLVYTEDEALQALKHSIDYSHVNQIIYAWREKSIKFLTSALS